METQRSAAAAAGSGHGLVLGKFMPPHRGHQLLVDFARSYCERVTVLVCSIAREPIPGELRFRWMNQMFGGDSRVHLVHVTDEVPQTPEEHPDFWPIWRTLIRRYAGAPIDYVFASEAYGHPLAAVLGAHFVPCDPAREMVPVSGAAVRAAPLRHWSLLPEAVRAHYVKRVAVFGPESTGKSTLAHALARHFETVHAIEHARPLLDPANGVCTRDDLLPIARGQAALEDALARQANRLLFCDTDPLLTVVWAEMLFGDCPDGVRALAHRFYDLTLLLDVDVPWVNDGQRFFSSEAQRRAFLCRCEEKLRQSGRQFVRVGGSWEARLRTSIEASSALLPSPA